jgi:hypothetical protein
VLPFTSTDAVTVLKSSHNLNASIKHFLKKELKAGDPAGRFIKDLKDLSDAPKTEPLERYIEASRPAFDAHLVALGKYAHMAAVNDIVVAIVDRYAESFNATYETEGEKIRVTNSAKFNEIVDEALKLVATQQASMGFGESKFFKNLVLLSVFDKPVLDHILSSRSI